jgi:hypothetical protein
MCLVIDTDCFALVFEPSTKGHQKYAPVLAWITEGRGRMIYGGTKYNSELARATRILGIVKELSTQRRTVQLPNAIVDPIAGALKVKFPEEKFNDEHIVALVIASQCCVVCTHDKTAMSYLKCLDVFSDYAGVERPKIFNGHKTHKKMCCDQHLVRICREQI